MQEDILSWIREGRRDASSRNLLWLSGPAGSGKTAIAGTIADECHKQGMLAASFFFSTFGGSTDRRSKRPLIATLVYQLMQHDAMQTFRDEVLAALERDPLILERNLDTQADTLLLNPLRVMPSRSNSHDWPLLILVDGLDECAGNVSDSEVAARRSQEDTHREILSILARACSDPLFPFRVIVASRPEQAIKGFFDSLSVNSLKTIFLNDKYAPTVDIELYIRAMLSKIGRDYRLQEDWYRYSIPSDWPEYRTRDIPLYLAREASEQFVYAATVIRYVQDGSSTPIEQLRRILSSDSPPPNRSSPFSALDVLYSKIMHTSPTPLLSATWLLAIGDLSRTAFIAASWYIKALLESTPGEAEVRLGNLTSILSSPSDEGTEDLLFTFYHKSLFDFLEDPVRSGELYVNRSSVLSPFLADRHYQVLKSASALPAFSYFMSDPPQTEDHKCLCEATDSTGF